MTAVELSRLNMEDLKKEIISPIKAPGMLISVAAYWAGQLCLHYAYVKRPT